MKKLGNILYKAAMFTLNACVIAAIVGGVIISIVLIANQ